MTLIVCYRTVDCVII